MTPPTDPNAPEYLSNFDSYLMAIRADLAPSKRLAFREWLSMEDWLLEDEPLTYDEARDIYILPLSVYRKLMNRITPMHYRKADPGNEDEVSEEYGKDTWWACGSEVTGSVLYWDLGVD